MKFLSKRQTGFTVVELIVAIVVGAIFAGSSSLIIASDSHLNQRGLDLDQVNSYVEGKVEDLRSQGFKAVSPGTTDITSELPAELKSPRSGSLTVSSVDSSLKKISITVTYNDQGANRTYNYNTYLGELGVGQY